MAYLQIVRSRYFHSSFNVRCSKLCDLLFCSLAKYDRYFINTIPVDRTSDTVHDVLEAVVEEMKTNMKTADNWMFQ